MENNSGVKQVLFYFSFVMVFVYLSLGLVFLFSDVLSEVIPPSYRGIVGGVFIVYGVFRLYILMRMRKARKMYEEQQNARKQNP